MNAWRAFGILITCLLFSGACTWEIDMTKRIDGHTPDGELGGWGVGGVIVPPGFLAAGGTKPQAAQTSLSLQCRLDKPQVMTVSFEIGPSHPAGGGDANNDPVAIVQFSTNGVTVRRKISILNGAQISAPAEYVEVKVFDESTDALSAPYQCDVNVTPGTRGGFVQPTLQNESEVTANAGGGNAIFSVPQDAGITTFRVLAYNPTGVVDMTKLIVEQTNSAGTIMGFQDPNAIGWVHLAPECTTIVVTNNGATVDANVYIQWGVAG